jgi:hypothetical protein
MSSGSNGATGRIVQACAGVCQSHCDGELQLQLLQEMVSGGRSCQYEDMLRAIALAVVTAIEENVAQHRSYER